VRVLMICERWDRVSGRIADHLRSFLARLLEDRDAASFLGVNRFDGVVWYGAEPFSELLAWLPVVTAITTGAAPRATARARRLVARLEAADGGSGYRVAELLQAVALEPARSSRRRRRAPR
jgi:hypothetical protein